MKKSTLLINLHFLVKEARIGTPTSTQLCTVDAHTSTANQEANTATTIVIAIIVVIEVIIVMIIVIVTLAATVVLFEIVKFRGSSTTRRSDKKQRTCAVGSKDTAATHER